MSKTGKLCLALFLALAVIVQYSFSPQVLVAYADSEAPVAVEKADQSGNDDQTEKTKVKEAVEYAPAKEVASAAELKEVDVAEKVVDVAEKEEAVKEIINFEEKEELKPAVKNVTVEVSGNQVTATYDGKSHRAEGFTYNIIDKSGEYTNADFGFKEKFAEKVERTEVGTSTLTVAPEDFENRNDDFKVTFVIVQQLQVTIDPAELTIKADDISMNLNDVVQGAKPEFTATVTGLKEGDKVPAYTLNCKYETKVGAYKIDVSLKSAADSVVVKPIDDVIVKPIQEDEWLKEAVEKEVVEKEVIEKEAVAKEAIVYAKRSAVEMERIAFERIPVSEVIVTETIKDDMIVEKVDSSNYKINLEEGWFTIADKEALADSSVTPVAGGDNSGSGTRVAAATSATAPATSAAPAAVATIDQAPAPTNINDNPAPKAATGSWALINLICALLTALLSLMMLIRYFGKRREEDELTGEVCEVKSNGGVRLASIIPAIGAIVTFIVTENMANPMIMVDKWTVMMVVILAIQAGVGLLAKIRDDYEIEDAE